MAFAFTMKTLVYIDGFNLYYGCLKNTPYKWFNVKTLVTKLLSSQHSISKIKYFTARVSSKPEQPDLPKQQALYFRALKTISNLNIFEGHFLMNMSRLPIIPDDTVNTWRSFVSLQQLETAFVLKVEEKGSDVNLASHLLMDAFKDKFDCAVVLSNNSDLFIPMEMVKKEFKKKIGLIAPNKHPSRHLMKVANFVKPIRSKNLLKASQFPERLEDNRGEFKKLLFGENIDLLKGFTVQLQWHAIAFGDGGKRSMRKNQ